MVAGAVAAALGFVVIDVLVLGVPAGRSDEAWFLWVISRVTHGAVLYRDVYFVSTPLPAFAGSFVSLVGGTNLMAVRALSVAIFVGSVSVGWLAARRAGLGLVGCLALLAGLFVYASPVAHFASVYSSLAILCALVAFWAGLVWLDALSIEPPRFLTFPLVIAGCALGLAVSSKPNTGILAAVAFGITIAVTQRSALRTATRSFARVTFAAIVVIGTCVIPVITTGGFPKFLGYVVFEKSDYLRVMSTSLAPGFSHTLDIFTGGDRASPPHNRSRPRFVTHQGPSLGYRFFETNHLVLFAAAAIFVWAVCTRRVRGGYLALCGTFAIAAILAALPSAGPQHVTEVMPLLLVTTACAIGLANRVPPRRRPTRRAAVSAGVLVAWLAFGVIVTATPAIENLDGTSNTVPSTFPHLRGPPISPRNEQIVKHDIAKLHELAGGDVFIVRTDAAYYYLAGNLRNPTPFDFPAESDFGPKGDQAVLDLINRHQIKFACINHHDPPAIPGHIDFRPLRINRAIRHRFHLIAYLHSCDLYQDELHPGAATTAPSTTKNTQPLETTKAGQLEPRRPTHNRTTVTQPGLPARPSYRTPRCRSGRPALVIA